MPVSNVSRETKSPPNVLFILADTLRADQLSKSRNDISLMPNVTSFAAESWNYEKARVQATWTKPSMASIFTSLYPGVHNVLYGIDGEIRSDDLPRTNVLPDALETMAEFLSRHGYDTAAVQSNANITPHFGFAQGFSTYEVKRYPKFHASDITDYALQRMSELKPPFFFYAHYMDTHAPYDSPEDVVNKLGGLPEVTPEDQALLKDYSASYRDRIMFEVGLTAKREFGNLSPAGEDYIRAKYDASSHYLDAELGRLIDHVRAKFPNTIIVLTSDHGEELWEHGSIGHGKTVFEELTRVPLIIHVPGKEPRQINEPVETIDILPTFAELLSLPKEPHWQGKSAASRILFINRPVFSMTKMSMSGSNRDLETAIEENRKLIVDNISGTSTVYGLFRDPNEMSGTVITGNDHPLQKLLEEHHSENENHPLRQTERASTGLTPEQQENIRALGYIDG